LVEIDSYRRKALLLKEGQVCEFEYFILQGCLRSYYEKNDVDEHTTMFAIEGWWTGNLKSFVRNTPSMFNIQALEQTTVIQIHKSKIEKLYTHIPKLERYFRILLQNRLLATQDRVGGHLSLSAAERYLLFIKKYPEIEQRVPLKHIASYLGITSTYLSRLRRKRMSGNFLH
jgi:CRP-like cAMP-binding protein